MDNLVILRIKFKEGNYEKRAVRKTLKWEGKSTII